MQTSFNLKIKDYDETGRIVTIGTKEFYSVDDNMRLGKWVRPNTKGNIIDVPILKNSCKVVEVGANSYTDDAIGMFHTAGNDVQNNIQKVCIFSTNYCGAGSCIINVENFNRVVAVFAARKLIDPNWINDKDEYMVPDTAHPDYQQFVNDAVVFSLFHSASNQSSLRNITYKDKNWNILNHFFFMSNEEMRNLANQHNFLELYNDTLNHPNDRFVFNHLNGLELSPDASAVLETARGLIRDSFGMRMAAHTVAPEYHLNAWDAGWYQIRNGILKDNFKDRLKAFNDDYKRFGDRLRPLVYDLGFLKR